MIRLLIRLLPVALILVVIIAISVSCSRSNPVSPGLAEANTERSLSQSPNRAVISVGKIRISEDRSSVDLIPSRTGALHLNMVKLLEGKACDDCLQIGNFATTSSDVLHCEVTLTHPFPGLKKYTGFDVRGIVVTGGEYNFPAAGHSISWSGDYLRLLYADGYTNVFNPTEFPVDPDEFPALNYIEGNLATGGELTATLNPYIAFMRDTERRHFASGQAETNKFVLQLVPGALEFGYIVDACWTPVDGTVTDPVEDFPPEANCLEVYQMYTRQGAGLTGEAGSEAAVQVEVWDHQGIETVSTVLLEAPDLFAGIIKLSLSNTMDERIIFQGTVTNELGADLGEYPVLTRVIDFDVDGNLGSVDAWNVTEFIITESGYPINDLIPIDIEVAGEMFFMGRDPDNYPIELSGWADPGHMHPVSPFYISKYEITAREFASFIAAGGYYDPQWWSTEGWEWRVNLDWDRPFAWGTGQGEHKPDFPISTSYYEAEAFCNWVGGRLPTEPEWELAARGEDHRLYPWGNEWDASKCAMADNPDWIKLVNPSSTTCPVGSFSPEGDSPYGLADCAGNIWEWTSYWASEFDELEFYIYEQWASGNFDPIPGPNDGYPPRKIIRGGGHAGETHVYLTFIRYPSGYISPGYSSSGFRVVFDAN